MRLVIATDHNGVEKKHKIIEQLKNYEIIDMSTNNTPTDDYPVYAFKVAEYVKNNPDTFGILLCGTGIGMSIAANKVKGIRCAHVSNLREAELSRIDNNANIISLSHTNKIEDLVELITKFIKTDFSNEERHIRRLNIISKYEKDEY